MSSRAMCSRFLAAAGLGLILVSQGWADAPKPEQQPKSKFPPYAEVLGDAQAVDGFIKLHRKGTRLLAELSPSDLNRDIMVAIAIARGIAERPLLGGMTWGFGDDWIWQFRKVDDRIQIVRRNVRFRATKDSPQEKAVYLSYTDSILFNLPILTTSPSGGVVVDLTPVFMSDLPEISQILRGFGFAADRSSWSKIKGFKDNVEIEVAATYASGGGRSLDTVPDARGITLYLHYSLSRLAPTGYQPRLADDRIGYFLTAAKDFSKSGEDDRFVRYINRWDLRKSEASAHVSPPKTPIIFWIEKTVPYKFRGAVRDGILEWNKAFEKAGFSNAIEVRQQPDDATWDPEDINYNTIRWITSNVGFAMGPSRVNPLTGQILDADIIFDADFVEHWLRVRDIFASGNAGSPLNVQELLCRTPHEQAAGLCGNVDHHGARCECARTMAEQMALGMLALTSGGKPMSEEQVEQFLVDGVKSVVIHEVGHTLGLRHNFKSSIIYTMNELNDPSKTKNTGLSGSIMDYVPVNISPKGRPQGDYFSRTIGPYDYWAIEYGYKPFPGGTEGEVPELKKIASRCADPLLQFATDGDAHGPGAPDPLSSLHDNSKDPIEFARWRVELIQQVLPNFIEHSTKPGEGYQHARVAFSVLLREHDRAMSYVAKFIGGVYVHRDHRGDPGARPPFVQVEPKKQREALDFLDQQVLGPTAYAFPSKIYDFLAPPRWDHWGMPDVARPDFPVHQTVLTLQDNVLNRILSPVVLMRILDSEMKVPAEQDAFTAAEFLHRLTAAIFRETEKLQDGKFTDRTPAINSLRRNLQQHYFQRLADLALGNTGAPGDCQTVAAAELGELRTRLQKVLDGKAQLDTYTRDHLVDLTLRIRKTLDARIDRQRP